MTDRKSEMDNGERGPEARAWYRHRWPWLLMLGPAIVIVAAGVTVALAVASEDGLVADDYYKRGLEINRTLTLIDEAAALGIGAVVDVAPNGVAQVKLTSAHPDASIQPESLRLRLVHPTRADADIAASLTRAGPDHYVGTMRAPGAGRWRVIVESDRWRLASASHEGPIEGLVLGGDSRSTP